MAIVQALANTFKDNLMATTANLEANSLKVALYDNTATLSSATTAYKDYTCTSVSSSASTGSFAYGGEIFTMGEGQTMEVLIYAKGVTAAANVIFNCYDCSCAGPMSGITRSDNYSGTTEMFRPVIIGAGGLNS